MAKFLKIDGKDVPRDIHLLGSALGMRHKKANKRSGVYFYVPYRNYFGTGIHCSDYPVWEQMVGDGLAEPTESAWSETNDNRSYKVTEKGMKRLEEYFDVTIVYKL